MANYLGDSSSYNVIVLREILKEAPQVISEHIGHQIKVPTVTQQNDCFRFQKMWATHNYFNEVIL